jgi:hypothetical protein
MRKYGQRAAVAAVAVALSTVGFAGTAFAWGHNDVDGVGGNGGSGGPSNANCGVPVAITAGVIGQGGDVAQCNSAGGNGGNAGDGID